MCGIAGLVNLNGDSVSPVYLKRMTDEIAHRGPDGEGQWIEGNVGLGHRRLAIIDLSNAGHQPMTSSDSRLVLTYNGEIFNFRELRIELEAAGYQFQSNTDTEVVLSALEHWGLDAIHKFNGMFAFAVWDRRNRTVTLARDRYGVKPLYYAFQGNRLIFASENKAIKACPGFRSELNKPALFEYFTFMNILTDQTLLEDVKILPPGTWLSVSVDGPLVAQPHRYWDFNYREPNDSWNHEELVEELERLFEQAVRRQLVGDVEIGTYLSGGMDSGSIAAVAAYSIPGIKSFTCGFDLSSASDLETGFDERFAAEALSARLKTEQYEMVLQPHDLAKSMHALSWHLEEPRVGQSYPNFYAAHLASRFVKVVLSGAGGDELFGGYPWRYREPSQASTFNDFLRGSYNYWQRLGDDSEIKQLFYPIWSEVRDVDTFAIFSDVFRGDLVAEDKCQRNDLINNLLYFESKTFLHGLLVVEDKLSMAHGLETRLPFLDNELVDFAMKCPISTKVSFDKQSEPIGTTGRYDRFIPTRDGKMILRAAMSHYLPPEVVNRTKQGFSAPDASWFKNDISGFIVDRLLGASSTIPHLLDRSTIRAVLDEHRSGRRNRRLLIWSLLNIEFWLNSYL